MRIESLRTRIFADGAELDRMRVLSRDPRISGFTTNPTLMRKAGVSDYRAFARSLLAFVTDKPISFEVFSDDFDEMERQAREIATWGKNVYVKIPVTNTRGASASGLIHRLSHSGVRVNVTAVMTLRQIRDVVAALAGGCPSNVSVFAGRIADTGRDPVPMMAEAVKLLGRVPGAELIWASPRELLNVWQADAIGCHIITITQDILAKLPLVGKSLEDHSLDTVKMFYDDARAAGFSLEVGTVPDTHVKRVARKQSAIASRKSRLVRASTDSTTADAQPISTGSRNANHNSEVLSTATTAKSARGQATRAGTQRSAG
jgi:transaldolase